MKTTIDYNERYNDTEERYIAALDDCREYLGDKTWKKFLETFQSLPTQQGVYEVHKCEVRKQIRHSIMVACSFFLGIEGYPVRCLQRMVLETHLARMRNPVA